MENQSNSYLEEDEIDLKELIIPIWKNKFKIIIVGLLIGIITLGYNLSLENYYSSTTKILPEESSKAGAMGGLGGLAGLAGINLGSISSSEAYRPDLYPEVLNSIEFKQTLIHENFYYAKYDKKINYIDYLSLLENDEEKEENEEAFDYEKIKKNTSELIVNNTEQSEIIQSASKIIQANYDQKTGVIEITATIEDPVAAGEIANFAKNYLTKFIQNYRTEKQKKELVFLNAQLKEAEEKYTIALNKLSSFRDQNQSVYLNIAKDRERRLNDELDIASGLYSALSTQKAQAEIQLEKANPIIQVLEPAQVPILKAGPKRAINAIIGSIIGSILAAGFFLLKSFNVFDFFKELNN